MEREKERVIKKELCRCIYIYLYIYIYQQPLVFHSHCTLPELRRRKREEDGLGWMCESQSLEAHCIVGKASLQFDDAIAGVGGGVF